MKRTLRINSAQIRDFRNMESGYVQPGETLERYQLIWLEQGRLHSVADGRVTVLCPGDLMICVPGQWHMQYAEMDDDPRFVSFSLELEGLNLSSLSGRKIPVSEAVSSLLSQALRESEIRDSYSNDMILCALEMALLTLLRSSKAEDAELPAISGENQIIRRAQQYISTHIREKLSVPTVAKNIEISPSYLTALFHKHLGISPGEYIRRVKLQHSKQLIREGNLNFSQIAEALNYSTVHHFSRQFKEKFGITPTEYARSLR